MNKYSDELKEYLVNRYDEINTLKPKMRNAILMEEIAEKFNIILKSRHISNIYNGYTKRLKDKTKKIKKQLEEIPDDSEPPYIIQGDDYIFTKNNKIWKIPADDVNAIYQDYAKPDVGGNNMTGKQIMIKYGMSAEKWDFVKRALNLYKDSLPISDHTRESGSAEYLAELIDETTDRSTAAIRDKLTVSHDQKFKKMANKAIKTLSNIEYFLANLEKYLEEYKPKEIKLPPVKFKNNDSLEVTLSDIHFFSENHQAIIMRLAKLTQYLKDREEQNINIVCLGDLVECFIEMHENQKDKMEERVMFDIMMNSVELLQKMILELTKSGKKISFRGIPGNHDRLGKTNKEDQARTGGLIMFELIKRGLSNTETVIEYFRDFVGTFDSNGFRYIIAHGEGGFCKKKPQDVLWQYGSTDMYNLIVFGHLHTIDMSEGGNYTRIGVPGLVGQTEYERRLGYNSSPGVVIIKNNGEGKPDILLKRL